MYPGLTAPLLVLLGIALVVLLVGVVRQSVLRRLALRQITRRRTEALLVVAGSMLGTAIIVGALVVGDTLGFSVRQGAFRTLGPVDERVMTSSGPAGLQVAQRIRDDLNATRDVDGVLTARVQQAAALSRTSGEALAEPRVLAWDLDFTQAAQFGAEGGPSGLDGRAPAPGHVVVNAPLARSLEVGAGDRVTVYLAGHPSSYVVSRVVPERGLAGTGFGANQNRNAFLPAGTLSAAAPETRLVTWVSNRGGVVEGRDLTPTVVREIREALGPLGSVAAVETPKDEVLTAADKTGDTLGALFLMIGSFAIIAGALLLVNIFVMLAEERKGQLGMLRAAGMKRSELVGAFALEGSVYAVVAGVLGLGLGVLVGRGVALVAASIFDSYSVDASGLDVTFAVTRTSLVNGFAMGLVISLLTVLVTSVRISRFNIIAAIRDLEVEPAARARRRTLRLSTTAAVLLGLLSVPAVVSSAGLWVFLLPSLAVLCLTPLLTRYWGRRAAYTAASTGVLAWTLLANVLRPRLYDTPSMAVYIVLGTLVAFSAVILLSQNQHVLLRPVRRWVERPTEAGLAGRLGLAYPLAKRFRTGSTLIMYTIVVLVLVLLTEISGVLTKSVDWQIARATAGYDVRLDFNGDLRDDSPVSTLLQSRYGGDVSGIAPLTSVAARASDPGRRTAEPLDTLVVGVPPDRMATMRFQKRLSSLTTDRQVWQAIATHMDYVAVDAFYGSTGGPGAEFFKPGDTFTVTDMRTGLSSRKTIAGILSNAQAFYSPLSPTSFPLVTSAAAVEQQFGPSARVASALVSTRAGVSPKAFGAQLQAGYLQHSLVATPLADTVRRLFDANLAFFRLMEGFLALGLLVGITGLGVVMVRAVRERRRTIGILRALGFRAPTIQRSFLVESGFVALEGIVLGSVLGVLTTWLIYQKSSVFAGIKTGFPVMWGTVGVMAVVTLGASLLATLAPARRAAKILPALATRVSE